LWLIFYAEGDDSIRPHWESPYVLPQKRPPAGTYLEIVHARREGSRIRQQVIATLGRLDELAASAQLKRLLRLAAKAMVLAAMQESGE
jgi:hypothetical protein